jgi:hypothetical protein
MIHDEKSPHRPTSRRPYRRFLIACAALAMALPLLPAVTEAQSCVVFADCSCTPITDTTFYPIGTDAGLGFATPQAECEFIKQLIGYIAVDEEIRAVGYLDIDYHHNGCVRGRRSLSQKSLAKGWRAWGTPDNISVSGKTGAHVAMAWTKKDADGKTFALINLYSHGFYRTSGIRLLDLAETDHVTFCEIVDRGIVVPTQNGQPDGPACCGTPYPKTPGERCTYRPDVLPGRQCRGG